MTDRLAELRGDSYEEVVEVAESAGDLEAGMSPEFEKYSRELAVIEKAISKIEAAAVVVSSATGSKDDDTSTVALADAEKKAAAIRKRLKRIADENKDFSTSNPESVGEVRLRVNRHQAVTRRFMVATESIQKAQDSYKGEVAKAVARQIQEINPDATSDQIDDAIRGGDLSAVVSREALGERHRRVKDRLGEIEARNQDIMSMEENIVQLHQMFVDMSLLVENQGELLNQVEYNTKATVAKVEEAHAEVVEARQYQKSSRKKKCWIIVIIVVIILIIVGPTLYFTLKSRGLIGGDGNDDSGGDGGDSGDGVVNPPVLEPPNTGTNPSSPGPVAPPPASTGGTSPSSSPTTTSSIRVLRVHGTLHAVDPPDTLSTR